MSGDGVYLYWKYLGVLVVEVSLINTSSIAQREYEVILLENFIMLSFWLANGIIKA